MNTNQMNPAATAHHDRCAEVHRLRNAIGIALCLLTGLLWSLPDSPVVHTLAMVCSVATGWWWAFGWHLLEDRRR